MAIVWSRTTVAVLILVALPLVNTIRKNQSRRKLAHDSKFPEAVSSSSKSDLTSAESTLSPKHAFWLGGVPRLKPGTNARSEAPMAVHDGKAKKDAPTVVAFKPGDDVEGTTYESPQFRVYQMFKGDYVLMQENLASSQSPVTDLSGDLLPEQRWQLNVRTAPDVPELALKTGVAVLPHPEKADRKYELEPKCGGEDAYFIEEKAGVMGVADGVGAWSSMGVDPGIFSRQLMNFAAEEARAGIVDPGELLRRAHIQTDVAGSSTALILSFTSNAPQHGEQSSAPDSSKNDILDGDNDSKTSPPKSQASGRVSVANLGDSGFVHLRRGEVLFQSTPQQHSFNSPYQLGAPGVYAQSDTPSQADRLVLEGVAEGDVLVLGTDGIFDNLYASEIAAMVTDAELSRLDETDAQFAARVANQLAQKTAAVAQDESLMSPFAEEGVKNGYYFRGGKPDDITIIVAVIAGEESLSKQLVASH